MDKLGRNFELPPLSVFSSPTLALLMGKKKRMTKVCKDLQLFFFHIPVFEGPTICQAIFQKFLILS